MHRGSARVLQYAAEHSRTEEEELRKKAEEKKRQQSIENRGEDIRLPPSKGPICDVDW